MISDAVGFSHISGDITLLFGVHELFELFFV